jgi:hypothetical protein
LGNFFEGLGMVDVGTPFNGHLIYFTAMQYISWPFGKFCGNLVYFPPVLVCCTKKNLATLACRSGLANFGTEF